MTLSATDLVLDPVAYKLARPELRSRLIPLRDGRRVNVGDLVALEFENAETLRYQVQEMLFIEGDYSPATVEQEIAVYGRYLPTGSSLSATFFLAADDVATVKEELHRLTGIQHSVALVLGGGDIVVPGVEIPGPDEDGPSTVTASVHFLRFDLDAAARAAFLDPATSAELRVDHPEYRAQVALPADTRAQLAADLAALA